MPVTVDTDGKYCSRAPLPLSVAVVGGGIGGCALALALQQRGISVQIFEKDDSFDARAQGYGLTMQQGMRTLRQLGFSTEVRVAHFLPKTNSAVTVSSHSPLFKAAQQRPPPAPLSHPVCS